MAQEYAISQLPSAPFLLYSTYQHWISTHEEEMVQYPINHRRHVTCLIKKKNAVCCVVVRGATLISMRIVRIATATIPTSGSSISGFVSPGLVTLRTLTLLGMSLEEKSMNLVSPFRLSGGSYHLSNYGLLISGRCWSNRDLRNSAVGIRLRRTACPAKK